ncbi:MBL fold metallo-hydrolase [Saccharibacillus sp. JS10]|uniref:MBL fold metallo-hydrolase n=1 Tax=Saccharibacillus sp. JS10 TaxID=2950552 RepID=UPI00210EBAB3|nr:MBL fold metallo-hydrolase [Saccharibacillus sp. JS10]MCQ4088391.1 MBL fold metallo-hydrolase [Saccharibacillus sp. JS10]
MNSYSWFTVEEIDSTTFAISEYGHWEKVHSYLVIGTKYAALIDTGIGIGNIKTVVDRLTSLPIKVLTTHVHWDHIGGHGLFEEVYVHESEQSWLEKGIPGLPIEVIRRDVIRDLSQPLPPDFDIEQYVPFTGKPTDVMKDSQSMDLGNRILTFLHTPGHSPGHLCFYEKDRGYLYTGDLIYKGTLFAFYPSTDPLLLVQSIQKINAIEYVTKILPGHHELNLDRTFIEKLNQAGQGLLSKELVKHGTGIHDYGDVKFYF